MTEDAERKAWHETGCRTAIYQIAEIMKDIRELQETLDDFKEVVADKIHRFGFPTDIVGNPEIGMTVAQKLGLLDADD